MLSIPSVPWCRQLKQIAAEKNTTPSSAGRFFALRRLCGLLIMTSRLPYEKMRTRGNMAYWLIKSEESEYSIDRLKAECTTSWEGVRNYQARNYLRSMAKGDEVLFYHSNSDPLGIVGLARVSGEAVADKLQFDPKSDYFDPRAKPEEPRWFAPELKFLKKFKQPVVLKHLKDRTELKSMVLLQRGSRLSVQPVSAKEFIAIMQMAGEKA
jgi:predicted RNA-binding protein with PUA-like domain